MALSWGLVPASEVHLVWPSVAPILAKAVERDDGRRSLADILRELLTDRNQLWMVADGRPLGAVVTSILVYPQQRAVKIEWLAGERLAEWAHLVAFIEDWARSQGCYAVETAGRIGLARVMKRHGYSITGFEGRKLV